MASPGMNPLPVTVTLEPAEPAAALRSTLPCGGGAVATGGVTTGLVEGVGVGVGAAATVASHRSAITAGSLHMVRAAYSGQTGGQGTDHAEVGCGSCQPGCSMAASRRRRTPSSPRLKSAPKQ